MKELKSISLYIKNSLKKSFIQEILATIVIGVTVFWHAQNQDLFERIVRFSENHEEYELDELLVLLMISSLGLVFIIYRRTNYLQKEVTRRK
ncbi:MAG: two-component system C4-dicarboxylate transport sensor histidine kinase DctB, partial [Oceanospirillaceae bacterium]